MNSSSVIVIERPLPSKLVKLYAPSNNPSKVFFNKEPVPKATPLPKSSGLFSKDYAGKVKKFSNPVLIFEATFNGVDIKVNDPTIENSYPLMLSIK